MKTRADSIRFVQDVYRTLSAQTDLSPNNEIVTATLTHFVAFLKTAYEQPWAASLADAPEIALEAQALPQLCGQAEVAMEKWWCRRFLGEAGLTQQSLQAFWYYPNYQHLVAEEFSLLAPKQPKHIVFLGGGALPLTAILLSLKCSQLMITCIDQDQEACALAALLVQKLRLDDCIEILETKAENYEFSSRTPVICASLLSAPGLFERFVGSRVRTVVLRDTSGLFRLCYLQAPAMPPAYRLAAQSRVSPQTINTSRIFCLSKQL